MDIAYVIATTSSLYLPFWVLIGGLIHTTIVRRRGGDVLETWIRWWMIGGMAIGAVFIAVSFWVVPTFMADSMGYATTPFQFEVSVANLAFAVMAILAVRATSARLIVVIGYAVFMWGAAIGHIYQALVHHNLTAGNTNGILVLDFGLPLLLLILILRQRKRDGHAPVRSKVIDGTQAK